MVSIVELDQGNVGAARAICPAKFVDQDAHSTNLRQLVSRALEEEHRYRDIREVTSAF
jgi:hypothetical protein